MERSFTQRMVPNKVFESYTPVELALRRATLEDPTWVQAMDQMVRGRTGPGVTVTNRLDVYFRHYINENFPLVAADRDALASFVLREEEKRVSPGPRKDDFEQNRLWRASHPHGQRYDSYPEREGRAGETTFDMLRLR